MYVRILDDPDVRSLQLALDALVQWSDTWQLPISINKCPVLNIGKITYNTDVHISGCTLPVVTHTRDLGVIVSSDLSPSVHITYIVSKATPTSWFNTPYIHISRYSLTYACLCVSYYRI